MDVKNELKYGFWMAFAFFILWVLQYVTGIQIPDTDTDFRFVLISNFAVVIIGLFATIVAKKKMLGPKDLSYGTLAISGGIALLATGILVIPLSSIFYHFINTEWVELAIDKVLSAAKEGTSEKKLLRLEEQTRAAFSAGSMGMQNFARVTMIGFFVLLIEALIILKLPIGLKN